ncbi:hypothetical protein [Komagataeibacter intermedius]|nr:hypothetical protein [Komagataeibacter intermedius]
MITANNTQAWTGRPETETGPPPGPDLIDAPPWPGRNSAPGRE